MWKLLRLEDGEWRETGETFTGTKKALTAYLAARKSEDGWDYKAESA